MLFVVADVIKSGVCSVLNQRIWEVKRVLGRYGRLTSVCLTEINRPTGPTANHALSRAFNCGREPLEVKQEMEILEF